MIFNRLFIFCIAFIIFQITVFSSNAYSQGGITEDKEFDLLLKEVLLRYISFNVPQEVKVGSETIKLEEKTLDEIKGMFNDIIDKIDGNGKRILYGDPLVPKSVLDIMDFSLEWWEKEAKIYGIMRREKEKGKDYLCRLIHAKVEARTSDPVPPHSLNLFSTFSGETANRFTEITKPDISPPNLPNLTWQYPMTETVTRIPFDKDGLFELSAWRPTKEINWKRDAKITAAAGGIAVVTGVLAYILNELSKPEIKEREVFVHDPSEDPPIFWTATALGEPRWKRPSIPSGIEVEEWGQHSDLQMWYPTPPTKTLEEVISSPSKWFRYGRDVSVVISVGSGAVSVGSTSYTIYKFFRSKFFPIKNFPE